MFSANLQKMSFIKKIYSKIDVKIHKKINSKDISKTLWVTPFNLELKLEADNIRRIIKLIKFKALVESCKNKE